MPNIKLSPISKTIIILLLFAYLFAGISTDLVFTKLILKNDIRNSLYDLGIYEYALNNAISGKTPFATRSIGDGYLYPPTALLIVEIFSLARNFYLKFAFVLILNVGTIVFMVKKTLSHYNLSSKYTWYWYVLYLGFAPLHESILAGQMNIIVILGILVFFFWQERPLLGGLGLSLAILTKISPILLIGYVASTKNYKVLFSTALWSIISIALTLIWFGTSPWLEYPEVFKWLSSQFVIDFNSQSLISKLATVFSLNFSDNRFIQNILTAYIALIILASILLNTYGKQPKETTFIIILFSMTILPNVMWYHHYVFLLFPILIWVCWKRFDAAISIWCLIGLLIVQIDRFSLTGGLLIHMFVHVSIVYILAWQIKQFKDPKHKTPDITYSSLT